MEISRDSLMRVGLAFCVVFVFLFSIYACLVWSQVQAEGIKAFEIVCGSNGSVGLNNSVVLPWVYPG